MKADFSMRKNTLKHLRLLSPHRLFRFEKTQLNSLAGIARDMAQVFFAGLVVAPIATGKIDWTLFILGLFASCLLWYSNLALVR